MDVLYTVRCSDDAWDLRMSLRSLERNGQNVGKVVLAGGPFPDWLSDEAEKVSCGSPFDRKQKNILAAILIAMMRGAVTGPCLLSSDDHFIMRPYDLDRFPWFCRQGAMATMPDEAGYFRMGAGVTPYRGSIVATRRLLELHGLPIEMVSGHVNTHLDARDAKGVAALAGRFWEMPYGYEPSTLFIACARRRDPTIRFTPRTDVKLQGPLTCEMLDRTEAAGDGLLSCGESALCGDFRKWMEARFPEPSRWEKR